jgi:hypothetical protein
MVADLLADHEAVSRQLRTDLAVALDRHHDGGTRDVLAGLLARHAKMAWMLRSFRSATQAGSAPAGAGSRGPSPRCSILPPDAG